MHTHIKYHKKRQERWRKGEKNRLMKGNTRTIRAKKEYANIKWCENMMTV
jgi:hypothetical protein